MSTSDYLLHEAVTGIASSSNYNENNHDLEDTLLAVTGAGVLSGATVTDGGGLVANVSAATFLLGIYLEKAATTVALTASATNQIWAVTDPDDDERVVYQVVLDSSVPERAAWVGTVVTDTSAITSIDSNPPGKWARPLSQPLVPQRDNLAAGQTQVIHAGEQVQIFETLTVQGVLTVAGKLRVTA